MSTATATPAAPRYTVERSENGWHVVCTAFDDTVSLHPVSSRQEGRELVKQLREGNVAEQDEEGWDDEVLVPSVEEESARDEADRVAAEVAAEHAAVDNDNAAQAAIDAERAQAAALVRSTYDTDPKAHQAAQRHLDKLVAKQSAPRVKAEKHQRTSLARVKVGDRLMTNLTTEGNGIVYAAPYRFSDGQVRTVAEVTTRKAEAPEMPGTLYTLVFEDGTVSEERYGTTSHYLAEAFTGEVAPEKPVPAPEPTPAPVKEKPAPKEKVATTASRANKLAKGSRLVLRDLGVVTVDQVSKTGEGKLEVAYTTADGTAGVREMWGSTNVRLAADA